MKKHLLGMGILGIVLLAGWGCRTAESGPRCEIPPPQVLSTAPISTTLGGSDPIEGVNRSIFHVVDFFYCWVYRPVGSVYGTIVPRPAVQCINNATDNLEFPRRFISSLLQAKFKGGGIELLRFLSNSTIGIAGLFDPAWHWFELSRQDEDFGQAFASWGIGPGCVLQLNTSTNIRDGVGMVFDYAVDIKSYFYGGQAFTFLNRGLDSFAQYEAMRESTFDTYQALKDYQLLVRRLQLNDWQPTPIYVDIDDSGKVIGLEPRRPRPGEDIVPLSNYYSQSPEVDTLRVDWLQPSRDSWWVRLSLFNRNFNNQAKRGEVLLQDGAEPLGYRYWINAERPDAPLVVILPGLGGHHQAATAVALAELCYENGMTPLIVSNTMNWEFFESTPGAPPGFTPDDVARLRNALEAVLQEFRQRKISDKNPNPERIMALGYSQGGLNALFLAGLEEKDPRLGIDRYVAINPPVDLLKALQKLDEYYRALDHLETEEAVNLMLTGVGGYLYAARYPAELRRRVSGESDRERAENPERPEQAEKIDQVPVERQVAQVLIAYSFRRTLEDMLVCMHRQAPVPGIRTPYQWGNRQALYDELAGWNYQRYCNEVLLPYYARQKEGKVGLEQLSREAGLRAIEPTLRNNSKLRVIHSADDFLLDQADRDYLRETLGSRLVMLDNGGHLGHLYHKEVQQRILELLQP